VERLRFPHFSLFTITLFSAVWPRWTAKSKTFVANRRVPLSGSSIAKTRPARRSISPTRSRTDQEIAGVAPKVVVALGATALKAVPRAVPPDCKSRSATQSLAPHFDCQCFAREHIDDFAAGIARCVADALYGHGTRLRATTRPAWRWL
jgi:hypothetical protein